MPDHFFPTKAGKIGRYFRQVPPASVGNIIAPPPFLLSAIDVCLGALTLVKVDCFGKSGVEGRVFPLLKALGVWSSKVHPDLDAEDREFASTVPIVAVVHRRLGKDANGLVYKRATMCMAGRAPTHQVYFVAMLRKNTHEAKVRLLQSMADVSTTPPTRLLFLLNTFFFTNNLFRFSYYKKNLQVPHHQGTTSRDQEYPR